MKTGGKKDHRTIGIVVVAKMRIKNDVHVHHKSINKQKWRRKNNQNREKSPRCDTNGVHGICVNLLKIIHVWEGNAIEQTSRQTGWQAGKKAILVGFTGKSSYSQIHMQALKPSQKLTEINMANVLRLFEWMGLFVHFVVFISTTFFISFYFERQLEAILLHTQYGWIELKREAIENL